MWLHRLGNLLVQDRLLLRSSEPPAVPPRWLEKKGRSLSLLRFGLAPIRSRSPQSPFLPCPGKNLNNSAFTSCDKISGSESRHIKLMLLVYSVASWSYFAEGSRLLENLQQVNSYPYTPPCPS
uniref:Uncharacterized protein n=1 Tax=Sphaerodactylus townsendi TaxID=933632 RepID=A0ACB8G209_9SAUR